MTRSYTDWETPCGNERHAIAMRLQRQQQAIVQGATVESGAVAERLMAITAADVAEGRSSSSDSVAGLPSHLIQVQQGTADAATMLQVRSAPLITSRVVGCAGCSTRSTAAAGESCDSRRPCL